MGRIVVVENVTLDGVMQSPGTEDDTRGGFTRGGWATPYADPVLAETLGKGVAADNAMLFGRRTYEMLTDGPFAEGKEHLGGFTLIAAPDVDAALARGARMSAILTPLAIEVRPVV
jgi:YCII-related domain-containing protein